MGSKVTKDVKIDKLLEEVSARIRGMKWKLYHVRKMMDLRLNLNLFKVFCMPLVRMGVINAVYGTVTARDTFIRWVRK